MIDPTTTRIVNARAAALGITPTEFVSPYLNDIRIRHAGLRGHETPEEIEIIVADLEAQGAAAAEDRRIAAEKAAEAERLAAENETTTHATTEEA